MEEITEIEDGTVNTTSTLYTYDGSITYATRDGITIEYGTLYS